MRGNSFLSWNLLRVLPILTAQILSCVQLHRCIKSVDTWLRNKPLHRLFFICLVIHVSETRQAVDWVITNNFWSRLETAERELGKEIELTLWEEHSEHYTEFEGGYKCSFIERSKKQQRKCCLHLDKAFVLPLPCCCSNQWRERMVSLETFVLERKQMHGCIINKKGGKIKGLQKEELNLPGQGLSRVCCNWKMPNWWKGWSFHVNV